MDFQTSVIQLEDKSTDKNIHKDTNTFFFFLCPISRSALMLAPLFGVLKAFKVLSLSFLFGISYLSDRSHDHQIKSLILLKKEEILWLLFVGIKEEKR